MYSLLVSGEVEGTKGVTVTVPSSRYLEYTSEPMQSQLQALSNDAIECLKSWPCLLMNEGRSNEVACVGRIVSLSRAADGVRLAVEPVHGQPQLINDIIWKLRSGLNIEEFEFSRNHFGVKDCDLLGVFEKAGLDFPRAVVSSFITKALPAPTRAQLIAAVAPIAAMSHSDIDEFLLECGVPGLDVPHTLGSPKKRAIAIVQFAVNNPSSTTAGNDLFAALLVRRSQRVNAVPSNSQGNSRSGVEVGQPNPTAAQSPNRVFLVHGRNEAARGEVVKFLSEIGLEAIVLHEQPNMGRHLLTKFIDEAALVTFAVILMTDDDVGGPADGQLTPRARQNVILELGYFLSRLGQARVCAIKTTGVETPSDFDGIVYITMDATQKWKRELHRELKAAMMPVTDA